MPLVAENGMDWMYANCSTTAQQAHWIGGRNSAMLPYLFSTNCIQALQQAKNQRSIDFNSQPDYREKLEVELKELRDSEMWQTGKTVRSLGPENQK